VTIVYFDSSAFVKLVVEEDGSEVAATLWDGCDAAVTSRLAYPEVRAALAAAGRARRLDPAEQRGAEAMWEDFWAATRTVELTETITAHAGDLAGRRSHFLGRSRQGRSCKGIRVRSRFARWTPRLQSTPWTNDQGVNIGEPGLGTGEMLAAAARPELPYEVSGGEHH
jgi:uncharacterized protein